MNLTTVNVVREASRVILVTKNGTDEKRLTAHETLDLIRKVLAEGGHFSDSGSFRILPDGTHESIRTTTIVEKGCKAPTR